MLRRRWRGRRIVGFGQAQQVEWTLELRQPFFGDVQIQGGGLQVLVSQQQLNGAQVHAGFEKMRGEAVPQGMNAMTALHSPFDLLRLPQPDDLPTLPEPSRPTPPKLPPQS